MSATPMQVLTRPFAVEPVTKYGFSDERSSLCGGDFVSTARVVGTPDRRVTRYFSTNRQ